MFQVGTCIDNRFRGSCNLPVKTRQMIACVRQISKRTAEKFPRGNTIIIIFIVHKGYSCLRLYAIAMYLYSFTIFYIVNSFFKFFRSFFLEINRTELGVPLNEQIRCATRLYFNNIAVFWTVCRRTETDGFYLYSCNRFIFRV